MASVSIYTLTHFPQIPGKNWNFFASDDRRTSKNPRCIFHQEQVVKTDHGVVMV